MYNMMVISVYNIFYQNQSDLQCLKLNNTMKLNFCGPSVYPSVLGISEVSQKNSNVLFQNICLSDF